MKGDPQIELVNHIVVFSIRKAKTCKSLFGSKLRQQIHTYSFI